MQFQGQNQGMAMPTHNCFKCCVICFLFIFFIFGCCLISYNLEMTYRLQQIERTLNPFSSKYDNQQLKKYMNNLMGKNSETWRQLFSIFLDSDSQEKGKKVNKTSLDEGEDNQQLLTEQLDKLNRYFQSEKEENDF